MKNTKAKDHVRTRPSANARRAIARLPRHAPRPAATAVAVVGSPPGGIAAAAVPLAAGTSVGAVVVVQEDLLQRRLAAAQREHGMAGQRLDHRRDAAGHLEV